MRKKIAAVFVNKQSIDYYKCSGFFDEIKSKYDLEIFKLKFDQTDLNEITEKNLPTLDFGKRIDLLRFIKEKANLRYNNKKFNNKNHHLYIKFNRSKKIKKKLKNSLINFFSYFLSTKKGIEFLDLKISSKIENTGFFKKCLKELKTSKPDLVYITHQNTSYSLGFSLAAKKLNIPVACFIYSWDNIVKGNKLVNADYYFVWSDYMKKEILEYYKDEVKETNVFVTGTPQFHQYLKKDITIDKQTFFEAYKIPEKYFYICFSGNLTSIGQDDALYLKDLAEEVVKFNSKNTKKIHVLVRANPADYNYEFIPIIKKFSNVLTDVNPDWNTTNIPLPVKKNVISLAVLNATIKFSDAVLNVGSTMALDATILDKLAYYLDYKIPNGSKEFNIDFIYKFVHFKSQKEMGEPIKHIRSKEELKLIFEQIQNPNNRQLKVQKKWSHKIVKHPLNEVSERMALTFDKILKKCI